MFLLSYQEAAKYEQESNFRFPHYRVKKVVLEIIA